MTSQLLNVKPAVHCFTQYHQRSLVYQVFIWGSFFSSV
uniref:Uncharacterized protein n=1 Tax=Arundo donax TaxID=35708 RepID=A0A0A9D045_ARUDO